MIARIEVFPGKLWRLLPSFKPVEVMIAEATGYADIYKSDKGKYFGNGALFYTRQAALDHAEESLKDQQERINKMQKSLDKKAFTWQNEQRK